MGILLLKTIVNTTFFFNVDFKLNIWRRIKDKFPFPILKGYQI